MHKLTHKTLMRGVDKMTESGVGVDSAGQEALRGERRGVRGWRRERGQERGVRRQVATAAT